MEEDKFDKMFEKWHKTFNRKFAKIIRDFDKMFEQTDKQWAGCCPLNGYEITITKRRIENDIKLV